MSKPVLFFAPRTPKKGSLLHTLAKAHVDAFTRKDGTQVAAHETLRAAAKARNSAPGFHTAGINHSPAMKYHGDREAEEHNAAQAEYERSGDSPKHRAHKEAAQAHANAGYLAKNRATGYDGEGFEAASARADVASHDATHAGK